MRIAAVIVIALALGFGGGYWTVRAAGPTPSPPPAPLPATQSAPPAGHEEMDAAHEARVKVFPAKTAGLGAQPLAPRITGGVKVFELTAGAMQWEVEPGILRAGFAYNGQIPGPILRLREGDRVRVTLRNDLPESTSIHFHGLMTPNAMDGVPFITQPPVRPGHMFAYEFVAKPVGSHITTRTTATTRSRAVCSARSSSIPGLRPAPRPIWMSSSSSMTARWVTRSTARAFRPRNRSWRSSGSASVSGT